MVAFSSIKVGDNLWDAHRVRQGNTTIRRMGNWPVTIKEIDAERRRALVSWNGNTPKWWGERQIKSLRRSKKEEKR